VVQHAERLASLCHQPSVSAGDLKAAQDELIAARQVAMPTAMVSPAFGPITTALFRDLYDGRVLDTRTRADRQAQAYRTWKTRIYEVRDRLDQAQGRSGHDVHRSGCAFLWWKSANESLARCEDGKRCQEPLFELIAVN